MNKNFLNDIEFKRNVELKSPKKLKSEPKTGNAIFQKKLIRLIFFIVILVMLFYGGRYAICCIVSFCQGTEYQSWPEIKKSYQEYKRGK